MIFVLKYHICDERKHRIIITTISDTDDKLYTTHLRRQSVVHQNVGSSSLRSKRPDGASCQQIPVVLALEELSNRLLVPCYLHHLPLNVPSQSLLQRLRYHRQFIPGQRGKSDERISVGTKSCSEAHCTPPTYHYDKNNLRPAGSVNVNNKHSGFLGILATGTALISKLGCYSLSAPINVMPQPPMGPSPPGRGWANMGI